MAKTAEDLENSRKIRDEVLKKYGFIPSSVIEPDYEWGKDIIELDSRKQDTIGTEKQLKMSYNKITYTTATGEEKSVNVPIKAFQEVNFKLHDVIIIKWKSSLAQCFASQIEERKTTAKMHEYLIVGRK